MLIWIVKLSALSLGLSYATPSSPCQKLQHTQLTSLNERMNQMIEALYSSSILAKPKSDSSSESSTGHDYMPNSHYETQAYSPSYLPATLPPHVIYVAPPAVPTLAYAPPVPYPPPTLPHAIPAYYPPEPVPPPEYSYPRTVRYSWAPTTYSYEHTYSQPPQPPIPPPLPVYPPQYPHQPPPKAYEYMYTYPTEYPTSTVPYPPRPQPPSYYATVAEYAPPHPPIARYTEPIPTPPKYI